MPTSVVMPALEMAQETGKLVSWKKKEGEQVTNAALDGLHARLKKSGKLDKSWSGAIALARRFISKGGV